MPECLMIEAMAQTAGILVGEAKNFKEKVILAKIKKAVFSRLCQAGDTIEIIGKDRIDCRRRPPAPPEQLPAAINSIAEIDLMFSHIDQNLAGKEFPKENFVFTDMFKSLLQGAFSEGRQIGDKPCGTDPCSDNRHGGGKPAGLTAVRMWEGLCAGKSGIRRITTFDPVEFHLQIGGRGRGIQNSELCPKIIPQVDQADVEGYRACGIAADEAVERQRPYHKGNRRDRK